MQPTVDPMIRSLLTLNDAGGGSKCPIGQEIGSHFSQDHAMVTKILDFKDLREGWTDAAIMPCKLNKSL